MYEKFRIIFNISYIIENVDHTDIYLCDPMTYKSIKLIDNVYLAPINNRAMLRSTTLRLHDYARRNN
jgi:hypothetical protein